MVQSPPRLIGHRGGAGHAPENTLASLRRVAALGCTWVEFDCMLTADRVPVLFHDNTLFRTTGSEGIMGQTPYESVARLDAGGWFDDAHAGEPVPTLEAALRLMDELGLGGNPEIKPCTGQDRATGEVVATTVARHWPADVGPPVLSSFSLTSLQAAKRVAPEICRAVLFKRLPWDWRYKAASVEAVALHLGDRAVTTIVMSDLNSEPTYF